MNKTVSLVRHSDEEIEETIAEALKLMGYTPPQESIKSVVIKPNLCYYWDSTTGYTTDPQVVSGIIDAVRKRHGSAVEIAVAEADATAMKTKYAFPMLGYEKLAKQKNVKLVNLSQDELVDRKVSVNNREISFKVPQILLNADLFINAPKLKVMTATHITCAMKNMFGAIGTPRKFGYHPLLEEAIVGINKILRPHVTIVDGLIALGHLPVKMDLIMASSDAFSIDWVASQIMGYNPRRLKFMRIALEERMGDPKEIKIVGEDLESLVRLFPHVNTSLLKLGNYLQIKLLELYSKIVGDVIPPFLDKS